MKTVTLLMLSIGAQLHVSRAFEYWEDAKEQADKYNEIILKEGLPGYYIIKTIIVECR